MWLLSAVNAYFTYDQPVIYGLIEERRILGMLAYFPLMVIIRKLDYDLATFYKYMIISSLIAVAYGVLYHYGLTVTFNEIERNLNQARADRLGVGLHYAVLSMFICVAYLSYLKNKKPGWILLLIVFVFYIVFMGQARGVTIASLFAALLIARNFSHMATRNTVLLVLAAMGIAMLLPFITVSDSMIKITGLYQELLSEDYYENSVRAHAINVIFDEFSLLGNGGLWLQWKGGFARFYSGYFFLSDVGIFGTLHRYGMLSIIFVTATLLMMRISMRNIPKGMDREIVKAVFIYLILLWPMAAIVESRSFVFVTALAVAGSYSNRKNLSINSAASNESFININSAASNKRFININSAASDERFNRNI